MHDRLTRSDIEKMQKEGKPLPAGETLNRDAKEMEGAAKADARKQGQGEPASPPDKPRGK